MCVCVCVCVCNCLREGEKSITLIKNPKICVFLSLESIKVQDFFIGVIFLQLIHLSPFNCLYSIRKLARFKLPKLLSGQLSGELQTIKFL